MRLATEAARLAAGRKLVRGSIKDRSSSSSASGSRALGGRSSRRRVAGRAGESRYVEIEGGGSTTADCREINIGMSLARSFKVRRTLIVRVDFVLSTLTAVEPFQSPR